MSLTPQGDNIRNAIKYISEERKHNTENKKLKTIIDEACLKYDLSPKDADFVMRFALESKE